MNSFSNYFVDFRLKSGIKSLSHLADLLVDKNLIMETSSLSRWQSGSRVPKSRNVLLSLLEIFIEHNGINNIDDANLFLESADKGYLTNSEISKLKLSSLGPHVLPPRFDKFVGREKIISEIFLRLSKKHQVIISGLGGIGKSTLAIEYAYRHKFEYPDGILWAKVDTSDEMTIMATFIHMYGRGSSQFRDAWSRSQILRSILMNKKVLIILDNVSNEVQIKNLIPNTHDNHLIITSRKHNISSISNESLLNLDVFNTEESLQIFSKKLGLEYVNDNKDYLSMLSMQVGGLPIAINILANRFKYLKKINIDKIKKIFEKDILENLKNENNNIKLIFESSYHSLNSKQKKVLSATGVFNGSSFSYEAVAFVSKTNSELTLECLEQLRELSLVYKADAENRYKLHPLMYEFIKLKYTNIDKYVDLCKYYLNKYKIFKKRESVFDNSLFEHDVENIDYLMLILAKNDVSYLVVELWEYYVLTLWDLGLWDLIIKLSSILIKISKKTGDTDIESRVQIRDLGILYFHRNQLKKAKTSIDQGLKLAKVKKNKFLIAYAKLRFGMIELQKNKLEASLKYLNQALKDFRELDEIGRVGETLCYMSSVYLRKNNVKKSISLSEQALSECSLINHKRCMSDALSYQAEARLKKGDFNKSKKLFIESLKIDEEISRIGQIWVYNNFALKVIDVMQNRTNYDDFLDELKESKNKLNLKWRLEGLEDFIHSCDH